MHEVNLPEPLGLRVCGVWETPPASRSRNQKIASSQMPLGPLWPRMTAPPPRGGVNSISSGSIEQSCSHLFSISVK